MILSFKKQFKQPILTGTKIHTIREDSTDRWSEGKHIHMATGVRTKHYDCFKELPCTGIQSIHIRHNANGWKNIFIGGFLFCVVNVYEPLKGSVTDLEKLKNLAINDGFEDLADFFTWFNSDFKGKLIHWTDKRY
jgi:hypothetical protein